MYITLPKCVQGSGVRAYEPKSGDEIYFNVAAVKQFGYDYELKIGENICMEDISAKVIERKIHKKYPNKKWWQFWIKQEKYVDGYILLVL